MKTEVKERNVETNVSDRSEFRASNTAKVFHMLISGLYSDKPQSITREIWSNARDAHVDAGCPEKPFDVIFPSLFNPTFTVRDYGVSMDHETIMGLYTNLGESTKEDSNDGVGKWGIGSKAPFSYTDTFSVTTYLDGTARHYTAVIEKGGIPAMYLMATTETDEPNGVQVSFPVQSDDVRSFRRAAQRVSYGFDVKPNVVGLDEGEEFEGWINPDILTDGPGWKLLRTPLEGYSGKSYAKMGCVLYPINSEAMESLTTTERQILATTMVIEFPIGSLEITPSRESLQYGPDLPTEASIKTRIAEIVDEITDTLVADYANCKTMWEACLKFREHMDLDLPNTLKDIVRERAVWQGETVRNSINIEPKRLSNQRRAIELCELGGRKLERLMHLRYDQNGYNNTVTVSNGTILIIEDLSLPSTERAKRVGPRVTKLRDDRKLAGKPTTQIIWIKFHGVSKREADELMQILMKLDGIETYMMTDLEAPEINRSGSSGRSKVKVRVVGFGWRDQYEQTVDLTDDEMDAGGIFVKICRREAVRPNHRGGEPKDVIEALQNLDVIPRGQPVYAVPKTLWSRFDRPEWKELYAFADDYLDDNASVEALVEAEAVAEALGSHLLQFVETNVDVERLVDKSDTIPAITFFKGVKEMDTSQADRVRRLARVMYREAELTEAGSSQVKVEAEYHIELLNEVYPLLDVLSRQCQYERNLVDKVTNYVYMCDAAQVTLRAATAA